MATAITQKNQNDHEKHSYNNAYRPNISHYHVLFDVSWDIISMSL